MTDISFDPLYIWVWYPGTLCSREISLADSRYGYGANVFT